MQFVAEDLILQDEAGKDTVVQAEFTQENVPYYNLTPLSKKDETCVVFLREDGFTFTTNQLNRRQSTSGKDYTFWGKNTWFATRIKCNTKGQTTVNVFRRSNAGSLQNITRSAGILLSDMPRSIRQAYALCFKAAYIRVVGREPLDFEQALTRLLDNKDRRGSSIDGFVRAYAYPAARDCQQQRVAGGLSPAKAELLEYARDLEEYFKEGTWARAMQKLFGRHQPSELQQALQPTRVTAPVLEGAYIVRSIVPPEDLLRYRMPAHREYEVAPLADIRRALRTMPETHRQALLKSWREDQLVVNAFCANIRHAARARMARYELKPLRLPGLENAKTWGQLTRVFLEAYNAELQAMVEDQQDAVNEMHELMQEAFTTVEADGIELFGGLGESWGLQATDMYNTSLPLLQESSSTQRYLTFHMKIFVWRLPFAHGNPLNTFHRHLIKAAPKVPRRKMLQLRTEVALPLMRELVKALDSLLRRYGVPRTPRNRTRLFVAAEMFYNTAYRHRQPKMGKNFYAMIASDYPLPAVYEAHIMGMGPEEYAEFALFPDAVRANMTHYNRAAPESDWF